MTVGICQVCRRRYLLNRDGGVRAHLFIGRRCYGSWERPVAAHEAQKEEAK